MVNRTFRTRYNRKRIRRVVQLYGLMLAPRVHRRHGRPHLGQIRQPASNQRWCSDVFLIPCWSGEVVSLPFIRLAGLRGSPSVFVMQPADAWQLHHLPLARPLHTPRRRRVLGQR